VREAPSASPPDVAVLRAGSWGTALAVHLDRIGRRVRLWGRDATRMADLRATRENVRYLPGIPLPPGVTATADPAEALDGAGLVILAVPSHFVEATLRRLAASVPPGTALVSATKGIEAGRGRRMSQVVAGALPGRPVAVLSGPSFAHEVARGLPTALVVASVQPELARAIQQWLAGPTLRLYTNRDVVGVELGGALKNVMAIATGLSDGLGLGDNARAALITRGLAEVARLGVALGAQAVTFLGLAGIGDLVLTCTGQRSRNRSLGLRIAAGQSLAAAEAATPMVAEGVRTARAAVGLARSAGVAMPICAEVAAVLFEAKPVAEALRSLLAREPRPEEEPQPLEAPRA
jgi:glycerol-3-phosphate dehydrogenase (NAD(P)+)